MTCLQGRLELNARKWGENLRSLDIAEARTAHSKSRVDLQCNVSYLSTNVLTLAIAVCPYEEDLGASCLRLDITGYSFLILPGALVEASPWNVV